MKDRCHKQTYYVTLETALIHQLLWGRNGWLTLRGRYESRGARYNIADISYM